MILKVKKRIYEQRLTIYDLRSDENDLLQKSKIMTAGGHR
jgi:hypothetical protein